MLARNITGGGKKSTYKPYIKRVSATEFTVQSERFVYVLYLVTVLHDGSTLCECEAGKHGRMCKHARAVKSFLQYSAAPSHIRVVEGSVAPLPAFIPAPDNFAQLFA